MRFSKAILLLPASAIASPLFATRQPPSQPAKIVSVSPSGPGCPAGTYSIDTSSDGQVSTIGFDSYSVAVGPGADPNDREKPCDLLLVVNFPIGCTSTQISTTYHGFAQLESGVTGQFSTSYNISPGQLTGGNPSAAKISSVGFGGTGNTYTKLDTTSARVSIGSANQRNVTFVVRTRILLQASNGTVSGVLTDDDATISLTQQNKC